MRQLRILVVVSMSFVSSWALGQPAEAPAPTPSPTVPVDREAAGDDRWELAQLKVPPWMEPSGQGVGIGYLHGSWAGHWTQELRVRVPIGHFFGIHLGGLYLHDETGGAENLGGRLTLTGGTPVYLNLVRLYGGGSLDVLTAVNQAAAPVRWGGGGFFGFEFFMSRRFSFFIEIGGRGGTKYSGATIMAGMNVFPF